MIESLNRDRDRLLVERGTLFETSDRMPASAHFKWITGLAAIIIAGSAVGLAYGTRYLHLRALDPKQSLYALEISTGALDLGDVWDRRTVTVSLPITNTSDENVKCQLSGSCNCMSLSPTALSLDAGQTESIKLTVRVTQPKKGSSVPFRVWLIATSKGPIPTVRQWELSGVARSNLSVPSEALSFGRELRVHGQPASRAIEVESTKQLQGLAVRDPNGWLEGRAVPVGESRTQFHVQLTAAPALLDAARELDSIVELAPVSMNGEVLPTAELPICLKVYHDVDVVPNELSLGVHYVGETAKGSIRLVSHSNKAFDIREVRSSIAAMSVDLVEKEPVDAITIELPVGTLGLTKGELTFSIRDGIEDDSYTLTVPVSVVGVGNYTP